LALVEVRRTDLFNPALGERGYGPLFIVYWDLASDIMTYMVRDNHRVKHWTPDEQELFFNPDFMRRQWFLDTSVKTQIEIVHPDQFFLRPTLEEGKFPSERPIQLAPEVASRVQAQETAGRLVFEVEEAVPVTTVATHPTPTPVAQQPEKSGATAPKSRPMPYVQHAGQSLSTTLR
jgi:hypothetical protein